MTSATKREASRLVTKLIKQQGNATAAAATLGVSRTTIWKWAAGDRPLQGPALLAVRAVLAHPEDYAEFLKLARPAHRPRSPR